MKLQKNQRVAESLAPTPAEIAAACAAIQSRWTAKDRRKRSSGLDAANSAQVPMIRTAEVGIGDSPYRETM